MSDETTTTIEPDDALEDGRNFAEDSPETETPRRGRGPTRDAVRMADLIDDLAEETEAIRDLAIHGVLQIDVTNAEASITEAEAALAAARDRFRNLQRASKLAPRFAGLPPRLQAAVRAVFEGGAA